MDNELRDKLLRMTVANGCTEAEEKTAKRKLAKLQKARREPEEDSPEAIAAKKAYVAQKAAESRAVLQRAQQRLNKDWEDLAYDKYDDTCYKEFTKRRWMPV
jgi:hypothetical protein